MKIEWTFSDAEKNGTYVGNHEFKDSKGEWHHFEIIATNERIVFGGACNAGFLESGYIERGEDEGKGDTLAAMCADLQTYYDDGLNYVSRIVCNERM